ncbi:MAG: prolyl oligopeptidase family serine peptidase [bacterium]|nr:prolyl oligopeptidase family serine peptidase [bacterium]
MRKLIRLYHLVSFTVLITAMSAAMSTGAAELTLDHLFGPDPHGRRPSELTWRPGTDQLFFRWDDGSGPAYWLFDAGSGDRSLLARPADLGAKGGGKVEDLRFVPSGDALLYTTGGDLHLYDLESRERRRLTAMEGDEEKAELSPDGKRLAFVRTGELYLLDLASGEEQRLTHDGEPGVIFNGTTDWVYWEEIWGRDSTGFWWSGDSRRIAYYHIDDTEVPIYPLLDTSKVHPEIERQRYPKSGDVLPRVEIRVLSLGGNESEDDEAVTLDTGDDPDVYLARVHWHPDHRRLVVERLNRDQTRIDLLLCDASSGRCEKTLLSEEHPTWVNLSDELIFVPDGSFLWSSERDGWRRLYLHDSGGAPVRALTPEGWALTSLDSVDAEIRRFVFTAHSTTELGAAERHVFVGDFDGGEPKRLSAEEGWSSANVSDTGFWVHEHSTADTPPRHVVRHLDRESSRPLPYEPPPSYDPAELPRWRHLTIPGPDGSRLPAQVMKPAGFDPGRKYPVIVYHYGGPGSQVVQKRWRAGRVRPLWHKMMASRGYVLFSVDNQASKFFGKAGEDKLYRRFGEVELAGQLAGVEYLKTLPWVDAGRIGLWGWSGGGSHTLYSLLNRPGVWKAGISGAPVTDWHYYDAIWMERYLDRPKENPEGYEVSAPITHAANLADPLLLLHGTADDNVHPQNTFNMAQRLIDAGKPFELGLYPGANHSITSWDKTWQRHLYARMTEFFDRHLEPGE